jgi:hypothetical protein
VFSTFRCARRLRGELLVRARARVAAIQSAKGPDFPEDLRLRALQNKKTPRLTPRGFRFCDLPPGDRSLEGSPSTRGSAGEVELRGLHSRVLGHELAHGFELIGRGALANLGDRPVISDGDHPRRVVRAIGSDDLQGRVRNHRIR